jgi:uncharacterized protein (DUF2267 family)
VIGAFLRTLGERLPSRDALALAAELPHELGTFVMSPPRAHGETFDYDELLRLVAERAKIPLYRTERYAKVIGGLMREEIDADTLYDVKEQLPKKCAAFFEPLDPDSEGFARVL